VQSSPSSIKLIAMIVNVGFSTLPAELPRKLQWTYNCSPVREPVSRILEKC
jgi:hypothetical protein